MRDSIPVFATKASYDHLKTKIMKYIFSSVLLLLISIQISNAQIVNRAIVVKPVTPHNVGDTIPVYGMKVNNSNKIQYYVKGTDSDWFINEDRLQLLPTQMEFWEQIWFEYRGADLRKMGWESENRQLLYEDALDYFQHAKSSDILFEDDLLTDYLYQLIFQIYPKSLIKEKTSNFSIVVIKSLEANSFAFDNGMIVITTAQIAQTNSEKELKGILASRVANIVLEHNLLNLRQQIRAERRANMWGNLVTIASSAAMIHSNVKHGTQFNYYDALDLGISAHFLSASILENIGAKYSNDQLLEAFNVASKFMNSLDNSYYIKDEDYLANISSTISFNAWQEYNVKNYDYALSLTNKLYEANLATEEDYLLLSHILRKTSNTEDSNLLALNFLNKARKISPSKMVQLDKEAGMIYLRLNDRQNAKNSFKNYKNNLLELEKSGQDVRNEIKAVHQLMFKHRLLDQSLSEELN